MSKGAKFNLRTFGYELRRAVNPTWALQVDEMLRLKAQLATQAVQIQQLNVLLANNQKRREEIENRHGEILRAAQREERRHIQEIDDLTRLMPAEKQASYRHGHTAGCDLAGILARLDTRDSKETG